MKKIAPFFSLILLGTTTYYAQIGVNTENPQGSFHIDGAKDNPNIGTPTIAQQRNDLVVNNLGMVGIGTTTPTTNLEVNSEQSPAFKLVDGTQGAGKILVSDASGNATWSASSAVKPTVGGVLPTTTPNLTSSTFVYLNASITLPPGNWLVQAGTTLVKISSASSASWVHFALTDSATSSTITSDIDGTRSGDLMSGLTAPPNQDLSFASGVLAIKNNTTGNKTYYLWGRREYGDAVIRSPFASDIRERYFYAIPVN